MSCTRSAVLFGVAITIASASTPVVAEPPAETTPRGIVIVVGGVGGFDPIGMSAPLAFEHAGVKHDVYDFVWTHGFGHLFQDLQDRQYLEQKADELATSIRRFQNLHPDRPIYLVAKSGGTGLALCAAESLSAGTLERIILLSAAVSPQYDLRLALRATRKEIVSYYSKHDHLILNWGTTQFGTTDRYYGPSAGLAGFKVPPKLTEEELTLYSRLVQVPWRPHMLLAGYAGSHTGTSLPIFLRMEVARWLR